MEETENASQAQLDYRDLLSVFADGADDFLDADIDGDEDEDVDKDGAAGEVEAQDEDEGSLDRQAEMLDEGEEESEDKEELMGGPWDLLEMAEEVQKAVNGQEGQQSEGEEVIGKLRSHPIIILRWALFAKIFGVGWGEMVDGRIALAYGRDCSRVCLQSKVTATREVSDCVSILFHFQDRLPLLLVREVV